MKKEKSLNLQSLGTNDVPVLLEKVNEKINEIKKGIPKEVTTKGKILEDFGRIEDIDDVETLIKAASMVLGKEKAYKEAAKVVVPAGIKVPQFTISGHKAKDWIEAIESRVVEVAYKTELKKLEEVKKTLEENLSAEMKLANDLKKIATILKDED